MYNSEIMSRFVKPKFAGGLKGANGVGSSQSVSTNEIIKIFLSVDEQGVINEAKFKAFGSATIIATADVACEILIGLSLREAEELHESQILDKLVDMSKERLYAPVLAISAIADAINDYYKRQRRALKQQLRKQGLSEPEIKERLALLDKERDAENSSETGSVYDDYAEDIEDNYLEDEDDVDENDDDLNDEHLSGSSIMAKYFGINKLD